MPDWKYQRLTTAVGFQIILVVATGLLLRGVLGLHPIWWLAWLAPAPLLILALKHDQSGARWRVSLAAFIGLSANIHYLLIVLPWPLVTAALIGQTLLWSFVVLRTRQMVLRHKAWWTVLAYPVLWVAVDTLMAHLLPDGNWASLAYSQAEVLPVLQITSLFGVGGVLFLISLVPSALALAICEGRAWRGGRMACMLTLVLLVASLAYGFLRLRHPPQGATTDVGLVAVDDPIGLQASRSYADNIVNQYDQRVVSLVMQGAKIIVLPEKVAMLTPVSALEWQRHFGALAKQNHVWLVVGIGIDDEQQLVNKAWLFAPDGALAANYKKHYLAPVERRQHYLAGNEFVVRNINGQLYGLAICKDMHFAAFGRAYGRLQVAAMLVPAWDFEYLDAWMEARTTVVRGVENGYAVIRSGRESLLTVSDAHGRIVAERESSPLPGGALLSRLTLGPAIPTLYARIGDLFGWICVALGGLLSLIGQGPRPR